MVRYSHKRKVLERYSRDRSVYQVMPKAVVFPKSEHAISEVVLFAREHGLSVTGRGGGTGLSGAGIGEGIVIDFTKHFNHITKVGKTTVAGSGVLLHQLRPAVEHAGYMLPSVPLHNDAAIGGCVNTRSIGPYVLKYGTMDAQVKSLRGVTSEGWVLDTAKKIPEALAVPIQALQKELKQNKRLVEHLKKRPLAAGGYNLKAFIEHTNINDVVTHLLVGSVGTLVLLTEVRLTLPKKKSLQSVYLVHFRTLDAMQETLDKVLRKKPVSVQYFGEELVKTWEGSDYHYNGSKGAFIISFEEDVDITKAATSSLAWRRISESEQPRLWDMRSKALPTLEKQAKKIGMQLPSGIDDTSIHPKDFAKVIEKIKAYEHEHKQPIASFGHAGIGSIHLRPFIDMKRHPELLDKVGKDIYKIVEPYGGTLVGEHNAGRCRSRYLPMESKMMYLYMKKLKDIFDPENILNPKVMFNLEPVTKHVKI